MRTVEFEREMTQLEREMTMIRNVGMKTQLDVKWPCLLLVSEPPYVVGGAGVGHTDTGVSHV